MIDPQIELAACTALPLNPNGFNPRAVIPYGCTVEAIQRSMDEFIQFLSFVNVQLKSRNTPRICSFMMAANFSSLVGEFVGANIPKFCNGVVRNKYHNGHPDLIPRGHFPGDSVQHATEGIEIKASRYTKAWQGHNAENIWLMVFVFDSNTSRDEGLEVPPRPFVFRKVVGAQLELTDWTFAGRSATSRRTITASVNQTGFEKMERNWIYRSDV